jgi:hypothetical protein
VATTRKQTWDKAGQRWKKIYKGHPFYGERGVKKTDDLTYRTAIEEFERWRAKIDLETDATKPYRAEYEQAIKVRRAMMDWLRLEGLETRTAEERVEYDRLGKEVAQLSSDFARLHPPKLNVPGQFCIDPVGGHFSGRPIGRLGADRHHRTPDRRRRLGVSDGGFLPRRPLAAT